jgi:hypothetical protein
MKPSLLNSKNYFMALKDLFEDLKTADTRIFSVRQAQLLSSELTPNSLGFVYMPSLIARNINLYAQNYSVVSCGRLNDFYFSMLPQEPFERSIEIVEQQVSDIRKMPAKLNVFVPRNFVPKVINSIGSEGTFYWPICRYDEEYSGLFELHLNSTGMVLAKFISPKKPMVFLD